MDNSSINPVTEAEVRTVAERLVTTFVSLSQQSKELSELQTRFTSLEWRVEGLTRNNEQLKAQVDILVAERDKARADSNTNMDLANAYAKERDEVKAQLEALQARFDRQVADNERLNNDYRDLYQRHQESRTEAASQRSQISDLQRNLEGVNQDLGRVTEDKAKAEAKLERVQKALQGVEEAKAEASEEARADITAIPQPAPLSMVEAPKVEEEPWWKQQRNQF